jgi:hypothetical protein
LSMATAGVSNPSAPAKPSSLRANAKESLEVMSQLQKPTIKVQQRVSSSVDTVMKRHMPS